MRYQIDKTQQTGTQPSSAFAAAISTNTKLLLGLWGSAGSETINNEIAAIKGAITQYGSKFTDLVIGISCGSEDLYRSSEIGIKNKSGVGANPDAIANYIKQTKSAFANTALASIKVGHVDTWTAWYNTSNQAVIDASDFIGVDAYPYFESAVDNSIQNARGLFDKAIANVKSTTAGKEIWITETGFPVTGPSSGKATPGTADAKKYWDDVGCGELFNVTNTFWYTIEDNYGGTLSTAGPSFGIVDSTGKENFDLSCKSVTQNPSSSVIVTGSASATDIGGGSPAASKIPSEIASSASASTTTNAAGSAGPGGPVYSTSSVSSVSSVSSATTTSYTPKVTINSAGQTITTSVAVNGTGISTGTQIAPTASARPSQGASPRIIAPLAGILGAIMAVFATL